METQRMLELIKPSIKGGSITLDQAWNLLQKMNVPLSYVHVESLFKTVENRCSHVTNKKGIETLLESLILRDEFREIFERHSEHGDFLTAQELLKFLKIDQQEEDFHMCNALTLINKHEFTRHGKEQRMTLEGFSRMMVSDDFLIFNKAHTKVYQDMTLPLCNYLISSSHNTYLMADQLIGPSHVWAYGSALLKGCRCVEIDCWNGTDGEPIVTHGHTLTSKISFKDVLITIKENAFKASEYPIILSLENHCSPDQKMRMVHHLTTIFQQSLVYEPITCEKEHELPSPEKLKNKILLKDKICYSEKNVRADESDEEVCERDEESQCEQPEPHENKRQSYGDLRGFDRTRRMAIKKKPEKSLKKDDDLYGDDVPVPSKKPKTSLSNLRLMEGFSSHAGKMPEKRKKEKKVKDKTSYMTVPTSDTEDDEARGLSKTGLDTKTDRKKKIVRNKVMLSLMITYTKATRFTSFEHSREAQKFDEMNSMDERKARRFAVNSATEFIYHTSRFLARIYPMGARTDSSNYNPMPYWNVGCHMVALNFQTPGLPMDLQNGKFLDNGGCGFILKPEFLRVKELDLLSQSASERPITLSITIISGNQLRRMRGQYDKADPFVIVEIHSGSGELTSKQTKVIKRNALKPRWDETLTFSVSQPEMALVRFRVSSQTGLHSEFLAQYTLPLLSISKGYRTVPLYMKNGAILEASTLFVYVYYDSCHPYI